MSNIQKDQIPTWALGSWARAACGALTEEPTVAWCWGSGVAHWQWGMSQYYTWSWNSSQRWFGLPFKSLETIYFTERLHINREIQKLTSIYCNLYFSALAGKHRHTSIPSFEVQHMPTCENAESKQFHNTSFAKFSNTQRAFSIFSWSLWDTEELLSMFLFL